jgi:hypothetical protein
MVALLLHTIIKQAIYVCMYQPLRRFLSLLGGFILPIANWKISAQPFPPLKSYVTWH